MGNKLETEKESGTQAGNETALRQNIVRVFYLYDDFRLRVDDHSPVHYDINVQATDAQGMRYVLGFRLYAVDRKGRLMIFEHRWAHTYAQSAQREQVMRTLIERYADPLNALPGRLEAVQGPGASR